MKYLLLILFPFVVASCSIFKSSHKNSIIGKWNFYSVENNGRIESAKEKNCEYSYVIFNSKGETERVRFHGEKCMKKIKKTTYYTKEGKIIIKLKGREKEDIVSYVIEGNTMIIEEKGGEKLTLKRSKN